MKQIFLKSFCARCLTLLILALLSTNLAWGEEVILTENFSSEKATNDTYECSSNITTTDNQKNWDYSWTPSGSGTVFKNGIKLGKSSETGSVSNSTMLENIPAGTSITIKVYAAVWNKDGGKVKFTYNSSDETKDAENNAITSTGSTYKATDFTNATEFSITKVEDVNEITIGSSSKRILIDKVEVIYDSAPTKIPMAVIVSGTPTKISYFVGEEFDPAGLTVTATYTEGDEVVTSGITWNVTPSGALTAGTTSVTVTATVGGKTSDEYQVNGLTVKTIANTQETAYTVAEAKSLIDANPAELATTNVYVKGTVSQVDSYNSSYHSITYWISEDGTTTDQFEVYSGKNLNNTDFASKDDVKVGDDVVVYGIIKKFNSTYEFDKNNYLVSHVKAATLSIGNIIVEMDGEISPVIETNVVSDYTISYTSDNEDVVSADGDKMTTTGLGTATITATLTAEGYKEATTTFEVEVIKALDYIKVATEPTVTYKDGDKFDPTGLVITATYSDATTEDIDYEGNEDKFTFEPSLETALTTDITSVTITYAGKETTQEISVRALYTYDITWMANGAEFETTQVTEGDALVLPETSPDNVGDMVFKGWVANEITEPQDEEPEFVTNATVPTTSATYYAVFAIIEKDAIEKTVTLDAKDMSTTSYKEGTRNDDAGNTWSYYASINNQSGTLYFALNSNASNYNIGSPEFDSNVTAIAIKAYNGSSSESRKFMICSSNSIAQPKSGDLAEVSIDKSESFSKIYNVDLSKAGDFKKFYIYAAKALGVSEVKVTTTTPATYSNYCTTITSTNIVISEAGWATVCLPFNATITSGNATAYYVTGTNDAALEKTAASVIPAGEGVLLKSNDGGEATVTFTISDEDTDAAATGNMMKGAIKETTFNESGYKYYILANDEKGLGFYYQGAESDGSSVTCAAGKAVLAVPETTDAKAFFSLDNEPTGIENHQSSTLNPQPSQYNLNGMRVNGNYKGIVIMNGKKYINK